MRLAIRPAMPAAMAAQPRRLFGLSLSSLSGRGRQSRERPRPPPAPPCRPPAPPTSTTRRRSSTSERPPLRPAARAAGPAPRPAATPTPAPPQPVRSASASEAAPSRAAPSAAPSVVRSASAATPSPSAARPAVSSSPLSSSSSFVAAATRSFSGPPCFLPLEDLPTTDLVAMAADPALLNAHLEVLGTARDAADATAAPRRDMATVEVAHLRRVCDLSAAEAAAAEVTEASKAVEAARARVAAMRAEQKPAVAAALAKRQRMAAAAAATVGAGALDGGRGGSSRAACVSTCCTARPCTLRRWWGCGSRRRRQREGRDGGVATGPGEGAVVMWVLLSSQFWPIPSMSRRVINCAKLCLSQPFSRIKWIRQWAVDRDPVLPSTTSAKIGKTAIVGCAGAAPQTLVVSMLSVVSMGIDPAWPGPTPS